MKQQNYSFEELILDESFKQWVKQSPKSSDSFWDSYLEKYPEESKNIEKARSFILSMEFPQKGYKPPTTAEIERSYDTIMNRDISKTFVIHRNKKSLKRHLSVAASVSIVLLLSFLWYKMEESIPETEIAHVEKEWIEKRAPLGQKLTVKLEDGSLVKLNAGSRIIYPKNFNDSIREILLEGEAFFQVSKNPQRPFVVKSKNLITTVLGTSFAVKAYEEEPQIQVAVLTGKVLVKKKVRSETEDGKDSIYLLPNEALTYSIKNSELKKTAFNYNKSFSWKDNVLYFEDAGFKEITATLSKWYGKKFEINTAINQQKDFSGRYEGQSLEMVLEGISFTFGVHYKITDSKVIIF